MAIPWSVAFDDDRGLVARWEISPADARGGRRIDRIVFADDLRRLGVEGLRLAPEGRLEHLLHRVDEDELDRLADLLGDLAQVLLVLPRQDDHPGDRQVSGQDLALQPADREDPSAQGDTMTHRYVLADGDHGHCADDGQRHRYARRRAVRRARACPYVDIQGPLIDVLTI